MRRTVKRTVGERTATQRDLGSRRFRELYAALSMTSEAMLRARSPKELYQGVCDAAVRGGKCLSAAVFIPDKAGWAKVAAAAGKGNRGLRAARISVDAATPEGRGLVGTAFRTARSCVINDIASDKRSLPWRKDAKRSGLAAGIGVPLLRGGRLVGVIAFYRGEKNAFDREIVTSLERMARTIAFALDNLDSEAERRKGEDALRESEARFRSLADLGSDWYWEQDAESRFTRFDGRFVVKNSRVFKLNMGKRVWELGFETDSEGGWDRMRHIHETHQPFRDFTYHLTAKDGSRHYFTTNGEPIFDAEGRIKGYRGTGSDITERKRAEAKLQYLATHDGLTDLPNRAMFSRLLGHAIESAKRYERKFAVMFIDLDRFKQINDSLGHEAGDALLIEVSRRLKECLRASDVVARLGGDEFVVLVEEVSERLQIEAVARKILSSVMRTMALAGQECRITGSVGISMYPADAQDEQSLMKHADLAMYLAKEEGKNNFQFYSGDIKSQSREKLAIEQNLRQALERKELSLHYQAKLGLKDGTITGVEALLRWESPQLGTVTPAEFIPVAEETGLIVPIGNWVLRSACAQNVSWQRQGLPAVCVAVNLSPRQFADPDLVETIGATLRETGLPPRYLELEITESMVVHNTDRAIKLLTAIKEMGVRIAIDDFGTGYSSLAQLKRFPIDTLKVDRSFIREIVTDGEDRAITEAIIALGKSLGLTIVAEGVETQAQQAFLERHACDEMQGYYFSRPVVPEEFAELLRTHSAVPSV